MERDTWRGPGSTALWSACATVVGGWRFSRGRTVAAGACESGPSRTGCSSRLTSITARLRFWNHPAPGMGSRSREALRGSTCPGGFHRRNALTSRFNRDTEDCTVDSSAVSGGQFQGHSDSNGDRDSRRRNGPGCRWHQSDDRIELPAADSRHRRSRERADRTRETSACQRSIRDARPGSDQGRRTL